MANDSHDGPQDISKDERYRYIGFDVFPRDESDFWNNESEHARHLARIKKAGGKFVPLSRSDSIVASQSLNKWERYILSGCSLALLAAPFATWFSFTRGDETMSYSGLSLLLGMGPIMDYLSLGAGALTTNFLMLLGLMMLSMLFGALTLFGLYGGSDDPEKNMTRLKRILNFSYLPLVGWIVFFVMTMSPSEIPFGLSLGLSHVESTLDIAALANSSSIGLWIPFSVLWVNAIKGNEL
jgi:hypothetical protein